MTREEICKSMTLQDAIQVFKDTNCYGSMDIAKTIILNALEQKTDILDKIKAELLGNAEMHEDGDYYLRDKWVSEIIDKYRQEG